MTTQHYITLLLFLFSFSSSSFTQDNDVIKGVSEIISEFEDKAVFTDEKGNISEQEIIDLRGLFLPNNISITNVFTPSDIFYPNPITLEEYIQIIRSHYLTNYQLTINFSKEDIKKPIRTASNTYRCEVEATMITNGVFYYYEKEETMTSNNKVWFIIEYSQQFGKASDFKIQSINTSRSIISPYVSDKEIRNQKSTKQFPRFSIAFTTLYSQLYISDILSNEFYESQFALSYSAQFIMFRTLKNQRVRLFAGFGFSAFNSEISASPRIFYKDNYIFTDIDNDKYKLSLESELIESYKLNYLEIPLGSSIYFRKTQGNSLFISGGINFQYLLSSKATVKGESTTKGYYPEYHVELYDLPDYGFETKTINEDMVWKPSKLNINFDLGIGYRIVPNKWNNKELQFIVKYQMGLTDLGYKDPKYTHDFFELFGSPSATIQRSIGLSLMYNF